MSFDPKNFEKASDDLLKREGVLQKAHEIKKNMPQPSSWDFFIEKGTGKLVLFPQDSKLRSKHPGEDTGISVKRGTRAS